MTLTRALNGLFFIVAFAFLVAGILGLRWLAIVAGLVSGVGLAGTFMERQKR